LIRKRSKRKEDVLVVEYFFTFSLLTVGSSLVRVECCCRKEPDVFPLEETTKGIGKLKTFLYKKLKAGLSIIVGNGEISLVRCPSKEKKAVWSHSYKANKAWVLTIVLCTVYKYYIAWV